MAEKRQLLHHFIGSLRKERRRLSSMASGSMDGSVVTVRSSDLASSKHRLSNSTLQ
jgi:hypothetical protein